MKVTQARRDVVVIDFKIEDGETIWESALVLKAEEYAKMSQDNIDAAIAAKYEGDYLASVQEAAERAAREGTDEAKAERAAQLKEQAAAMVLQADVLVAEVEAKDAVKQ